MRFFKRSLLFVALLLVPILLTGCDTNDKDITITSDNGWYVNTSESISVTGYNGFKLVNSKLINNKDGSIRVILDFKKPLS